jgi:hypothetical protein
MSEFTRAQVRALMKRGSELIQQSQRIRRELEAVLRQISESHMEDEAQEGSRRKAPQRKTRL